MEFTKFTLISEKKAYEMKNNGGEYTYGDVRVKIDADGNVTVTGGKTPIEAVRAEAKNDLFGSGARLLGDCWERAYGDMEWLPAEKTKAMPWYFLAYENGATYGIGVKTGPNAFCSWQCADGKTALNIDLRNGTNNIVLDGREIEACTVVEARYEEDAFSAAQKFCHLMCDKPRMPERPIFGGNDWYCNYGDNSHDKIVVHAKRIAECAKGRRYKPYMVVDDGWELCVHNYERVDLTKYFNGGPWKYSNRNFEDMGKTAKAIEEAGAIPGIWFRPLFTAEHFPKEYLLKADTIKDTLDPSMPEVLEIIKSDVATLRDWGYKLIKHDFSTFDIFGKYGPAMSDDMFGGECNFADKTKTTAEIIKNMYGAIREAAGDEVMILGCNTVSHLSAGVFELQRTGDDTSGRDWEVTKRMGINTLAFRMPQHGAFYAVDADCVGITKNVPWEKNGQWLDVLAKSGTPLFVSIAEDCFTDEVKAAITKAFEYSETAAEVSRPVDWMENIRPCEWESSFGRDKYEW